MTCTLTNMFPIDIQDYIYAHVERDTRLDDLEAKVQSMVDQMAFALAAILPMIWQMLLHNGGWNAMSFECLGLG